MNPKNVHRRMHTKKVINQDHIFYIRPFLLSRVIEKAFTPAFTLASVFVHR